MFSYAAFFSLGNIVNVDVSRQTSARNSNARTSDLLKINYAIGCCCIRIFVQPGLTSTFHDKSYEHIKISPPVSPLYDLIGSSPVCFIYGYEKGIVTLRGAEDCKSETNRHFCDVNNVVFCWNVRISHHFCRQSLRCCPVAHFIWNYSLSVLLL